MNLTNWLSRWSQSPQRRRKGVRKSAVAASEGLEDRTLLAASSSFFLRDLLPANGGDGTRGVVISAADSGDALGRSVSGVGDVNDDGRDDFVVGASGAGPTDRGQVYLIYGRDDGFPATLDADSLDPAMATVINGPTSTGYSGVGVSVSGAGDVNGDGIDDLAIGAAGGSGVELNFVLFGKTGGFGSTFDLTTLDGTNGFAIAVPTNDAKSTVISGAGDLNADGFDDVVVGSRSDNTTAIAGAGKAYVVFGKAESFPPTFSVLSLDGSNGFAIEGTAQTEQLGMSVSAAGDVNGDGSDDLAILGPGNGPGKHGGYVLFGNSGGFAAAFDLSTLDGTNGFYVDGEGAGLRPFGSDISALGDINADGFADIGITGTDAYIILGSATFPAVISVTTDLDGQTGFTVLVGSDPATFHWQTDPLSAAGDVNGDGVDDFLIGQRNASSNNDGVNPFFKVGATYIVHGRSSGFSSTFDLDNATKVFGIAEQDLSGDAVAGIGDVDGDGANDILIGTRFAGTGGEAYVFYGHRDPVQHVQLPGSDAYEMVVDDGDLTIRRTGGSDIFRQPLWQVESLTVNGTTGNDSLTVNLTGGIPVSKFTLAINANGGDDVVTLSGIDPASDARITVNGQTGNDSIDAGAISLPVTLDGGGGNDTLVGGDGDDVLRGNADDDKLNGQRGRDTLDGGPGTDKLFGGGGADWLDGGPGNDRLRGHGGRDSLRGEDGDDTMLGGGGTDRLVEWGDVDFNLSDAALTGRGTDELAGIEQAELTGGASHNTLDADGFSGMAILSGGGGNDTLRGGAGDDFLHGGIGADSLVGQGGVDILHGGNSLDTLNGGAGDDMLYGGGGSDGLSGMSGNDHLDGGGGNDTMLGGEGNDTLLGQAGLDTLLGESGTDNVDGGGDTDTVTGAGNGTGLESDTVTGETIDDGFMFDAPWVNV